jgi:zinc transport system substrate-binding protein
MKNSFKFLKIMLFLMTAWTTCAIAAEYEKTMTVFVSILPQKYFVQQICANLAEVHVMVAPGAGPATYEPSPSQMAALSRARLYFAVGVPFERAWLDKIAAANPDLRVIHTDQGIEKISMVRHEHGERHSNKQAGDAHVHGDHDKKSVPDPHIWLSPPLVKIQARHMMEALMAADPSQASAYRDSYNRFASRIDDLDKEIASILAPARGRHFMVFHPSWGYFAQAYGLFQIPIEMEGKEPAPAQLQHLIDQARRLDIQAIFIQPQFSDKSARMIAGSIGARIIKADPLALDWAENLKRQATAFREALK